LVGTLTGSNITASCNNILEDDDEEVDFLEKQGKIIDFILVRNGTHDEEVVVEAMEAVEVEVVVVIDL
jgi:hypothetical protein